MEKIFSSKSIHRNNLVPLAVAVASILVILGVFLKAVPERGSFEAVKWLLASLMISAIFRPYIPIKKMQFWDAGFTISFVFGTSVSFFTAWLLASIFGLTFGTGLCILTTLLLSVILLSVNRFFGKSKIFLTYINDDIAISVRQITRMVFGFLLFAVVFIGLFWIIGFNPVVDSGTENYMDYGIVSSIYRQQAICPQDFWYSGESLNYYYLGQAMCVFLTRVAFTTPEYGYNLMLCTFGAVIFTGVLEIVYGVVSSSKLVVYGKFINGNRSFLKGAPWAGGLIGAFLCAFGGNGHWLMFGRIIPLIQKLIGIESGEEYWFPDGTVYISTVYGDPDNGKNEFPAYSVVLGDLHAHLFGAMIALVITALLLDYALSEDDNKSYIKLGLCGILLGLLKGVNYWDFAMFFVITGGIVVFTDIARFGMKVHSLFRVVVKAVLVTVLSTVSILPFTLGFSKIASVVKLAQYHSPLDKLLVLWYFPLMITVIMLVYMVGGKTHSVRYEKYSRWGFVAFMMCAIGLIIVPELVYVEDIYGIENARFNTMFKLTYEAFILFGIIAGIASGIAVYHVILWMMEKHIKQPDGVDESVYGISGKVSLVAFVVIGFITIFSCAYMTHAVNDWFGDIFDADRRKGISATDGLLDDPEYEFECRAAEYINADDRRNIVIIEGAGESYSHNNVVSVLSGASDVAGWAVHEWLWRGTYDVIGTRRDEIAKFYQDGDVNYCKSLIEKYDVDYIMVGNAEYGMYVVNIDGFESLGEKVLQEDNNILIRVK